MANGEEWNFPETLRGADEFVDHLEWWITKNLEPCPHHVAHLFVPGFYLRQCLCPAGVLGTTKIHKTKHPYIVTHGRIAVWSLNDGYKVVEAPHCGITQPGTRRVFYAFEDTLWTTVHATTLTDPGEIEREIIQPHTNPMLPCLSGY